MNSDYKSTEEIHNDLIATPVDGHVGYNKDSNTYDNWKTKFRNYCMEPTREYCDIIRNFHYLEDKKLISCSKYDVLLKIFSKDTIATSEIIAAAAAAPKIKGMASSAVRKAENLQMKLKMSDRQTKDTAQREQKDMLSQVSIQSLPEKKYETPCSGSGKRENMLSRVSIQSLPEKNYETPCSGSGKRGYVLVIVNHEFGGIYSTLPKGNDAEKIKNLFPRQYYTVVDLYNKSKDEILHYINELACKEDSTGLICFLSSHGDETSLVCPIKVSSERNQNITSQEVSMTTKEENSVKIMDVLKYANTTQLENCPKIFFIDACRTSSGKRILGEDFPEPPGNGYYVGFSCLNQKTSMCQMEDSCGMYFKVLLKVFKDGFSRPAMGRNKVRDLNHLMGKVHHDLGGTKNDQSVQTPVFKSTLSGKVFLHGHK